MFSSFPCACGGAVHLYSLKILLLNTFNLVYSVFLSGHVFEAHSVIGHFRVVYICIIRFTDIVLELQFFTIQIQPMALIALTVALTEKQLVSLEYLIQLTRPFNRSYIDNQSNPTNQNVKVLLVMVMRGINLRWILTVNNFKMVGQVVESYSNV